MSWHVSMNKDDSLWMRRWWKLSDRLHFIKRLNCTLLRSLATRRICAHDVNQQNGFSKWPSRLIWASTGDDFSRDATFGFRFELHSSWCRDNSVIRCSCDFSQNVQIKIKQDTVSNKLNLCPQCCFKKYYVFPNSRSKVVFEKNSYFDSV